MANVRLSFGGFKACDWNSLIAVITGYVDLATTHTLEMEGFDLKFDHHGEIRTLVGVNFLYNKTILESELQVFNDTWRQIAIDHSIARGNTDIKYDYQG